MTLEQTRQLGIEFERRVQTMIPETEMVSKLDTETIYSYLNQYQDKFIHDIYKALDNIPSPSKPSSYVENIIKLLLVVTTDNNISIDDNLNYTTSLPEDFGLYIDSSTHVSLSYTKNGDGAGIIPNTLISRSKVIEFISRPQDSMRIMRTPIATLNDNNITVYYDRYTTPTAFTMTYYRTPRYMDLFKNQSCELPMDAFDDLVSGAVDLYVQYVAGAEARKRQMNELLKQNKKEDEQ